LRKGRVSLGKRHGLLQLGQGHTTRLALSQVVNQQLHLLVSYLAANLTKFRSL
jgi:hypothetical protein